MVENKGKPDVARGSHRGGSGPGRLSCGVETALDALCGPGLGEGISGAARSGQVSGDNVDCSGVGPYIACQKSAASALSGSGGKATKGSDGVVVEVGINYSSSEGSGCECGEG